MSKNQQKKTAATETGKKLADALKATATPKDTNLGPNAKFPFGIKHTDEKGNISWERFATAKERDARAEGRTGKRVNFAINPESAPSALDRRILGDTAAAKAAAIAPAAKPAAKPPAKTAAAKPAAPAAKSNPNAFAIHINKTGRLCFSKPAADRLGQPKYCLLAIDKGIVRIEPTNKDSENAVPVRDASGRPYISATKQFKPLGFDGSRPYDIDAKPYGNGGFEFRLA
jgi:hypothetical protein